LHTICCNILLRTIDYKLMHPFHINLKPFYSGLTINIEYVILSHPNYQNHTDSLKVFNFHTSKLELPHILPSPSLSSSPLISRIHTTFNNRHVQNLPHRVKCTDAKVITFHDKLEKKFTCNSL